MLKTHRSAAIDEDLIGQTVTVAGWVHRRRDHGGLIFIDLRDEAGLLQVVFNPEFDADAHRQAQNLGVEYVVQVTGRVAWRAPGKENPHLATGSVELHATSLEVLNPARTPPFYINQETEVEETVRLKRRYLDLRRERMQRNIRLRHRVISYIRRYLDGLGFVEIETPILTKSTPEGSRDYLVPSRLNPGEFFALPQAPQQFKQLLMVSGFERYFQIARCFRDEDVRAHRQPEFTQLDLEMAFAEEEDIWSIIEGCLSATVEELSDKRLFYKPFRRLTWLEAMETYGSDKPDLRFELPLWGVEDILRPSEFGIFRDAERVKALVAPGCASYSRREIDELEAMARTLGAKGLSWMALEEGGVRSPIAKFFAPEVLDELRAALNASPGDLILLVAGPPDVARLSLGRVRQELGRRLGLADPQVLAFAWIIDFPLFHWNEEERRWDSEHHPFTHPKVEDLPFLETDPARVRSRSYDLVCNGWELLSGSIRIHDRDLQERIFNLLGLSQEQIALRFGHMLEAFEYGAPPHGGGAVGVDDLLALLTGEPNIREVIAFPKTASHADLLMQAPSPVEEEQLEELHIELSERAKAAMPSAGAQPEAGSPAEERMRTAGERG